MPLVLKLHVLTRDPGGLSTTSLPELRDFLHRWLKEHFVLRQSPKAHAVSGNSFKTKKNKRTHSRLFYLYKGHPGPSSTAAQQSPNLIHFRHFRSHPFMGAFCSSINDHEPHAGGEGQAEGQHRTHHRFSKKFVETFLIIRLIILFLCID